MSDTILLGTRKGTVIIERSPAGWRPRPIAHQGIPVCYAARDPRDGTLWASLDHGHWGQSCRVRVMAAQPGKMCCRSSTPKVHAILFSICRPRILIRRPRQGSLNTAMPLFTKSGTLRLVLQHSQDGCMQARFPAVCLSVMTGVSPGS